MAYNNYNNNDNNNNIELEKLTNIYLKKINKLLLNNKDICIFTSRSVYSVVVSIVIVVDNVVIVILIIGKWI